MGLYLFNSNNSAEIVNVLISNGTAGLGGTGSNGGTGGQGGSGVSNHNSSSSFLIFVFFSHSLPSLLPLSLLSSPSLFSLVFQLHLGCRRNNPKCHSCRQWWYWWKGRSWSCRWKGTRWCKWFVCFYFFLPAQS